MSSFFLLIFVHFVAVITPGQSFIGITRHAIKNSYKGICAFSLGIGSADSVYIIFSIFGLSDFVLKNKTSSMIFYLLSGFYLIYLSVSMLLQKRSSFDKNLSEKISDKNDNKKQLLSKIKHPFLSGFLITFFNPEVGLFYSSIIANFVNEQSTIFYLVGIWGYMSFATFFLFYIIGMLFARYQKSILKYFFVIEKIFGIFLIYFAYHLIHKAF
jgi:threonine/homoserine/homoserine lactone efflux protein